MTETNSIYVKHCSLFFSLLPLFVLFILTLLLVRWRKQDSWGGGGHVPFLPNQLLQSDDGNITASTASDCCIRMAFKGYMQVHDLLACMVSFTEDDITKDRICTDVGVSKKAS